MIYKVDKGLSHCMVLVSEHVFSHHKWHVLWGQGGALIAEGWATDHRHHQTGEDNNSTVIFTLLPNYKLKNCYLNGSELHEDLHEVETQKGENIWCPESLTFWIWRDWIQGLQRNSERVSDSPNMAFVVEESKVISSALLLSQDGTCWSWDFCSFLTVWPWREPDFGQRRTTENENGTGGKEGLWQ